MKNLTLLLALTFLVPWTSNAQYKTKILGHADENDVVNKVIQTADGNYIAAGIIDNDAVLYKFDCQGHVIDSLFFDLAPTPSYEGFSDVIELPNGDVVAVGYADAPFTTPALNKLLVLRANTALQMVDFDTIQINGINGDAKSIVRTANGKYYLSGEQDGVFLDFGDGFTIQFDPFTLSTIGASLVFSYAVDNIRYVNPTADGNLLITGESVAGNIFGGDYLLLNRAFIRKIKPDGTLLWDYTREQTFKNKYGRAYFGDAVENPLTGNIMVSGTIFSGDTLNPLDVYQMLFSANGDSLDAKTIPMPGSQNVYEMKMVNTAGSPLIVVGDSTKNDAVAGMSIVFLENNNHILVASVNTDHTRPMSGRSFVELPGLRFVFGTVYFDPNDPLATRQDWGMLFPEIQVSVTVSSNTLNASVNPAGTYQYQWYDGAQAIAGASGASFSPAVNGTYTVVATDEQGCSGYASGTIQCIIAGDLTINNVSCYGGNDASAYITMNSGAPPFSYLWSNGTTSQINSGLLHGVQLVTVTDNNGCQYIAAAVITQPGPLFLSDSDVQPVACAGSNTGAITVQASGGTPPYDYFWSNGASGPSITNLAPGSYSLTLHDANDCVKIGSIGVLLLPQIAISLVAVTPATGTQANGAVDISVSGGAPPYSFHWTKDGSFFATMEDLNNLLPGVYLLEVLDASGCLSTFSVVVESIINTGEPTWISGLQIQPNPADGIAQVLFDKIPEESVNIRLMDATGRIALRQLASAARSISIDCSGLPAGLYWIQVQSGGKTGLRKLLIQR